MGFVVKGRDKFNSIDTYGRFPTLSKCLKYLDYMKRSCVGETVNFWWEEVED